MHDMFTESHEGTKSFSLWVAALIGSFCAATALLFHLACDRRARNIFMFLGYTIAGVLIVFLPLFNQKLQDWNVQGLVAASSLFILNLTETFFFLYSIRRVVRNLKPSYEAFWVLANCISLLLPTICSIILFSPIKPKPSEKLALVYLTAFSNAFRSSLSAWAYGSMWTFACNRPKRWWTWAFKKDKPPQRGDIGSATTLQPAVAKLVSWNLTMISTIESVILVFYSVVATWLFDPYYILVLGTITTVSRSYHAYIYYHNHGPPSANPADFEAAAAERNRNSTSLNDTDASSHRKGMSEIICFSAVPVSVETVSEKKEEYPPSPPPTPPPITLGFLPPAPPPTPLYTIPPTTPGFPPPTLRHTPPTTLRNTTASSPQRDDSHPPLDRPLFALSPRTQ